MKVLLIALAVLFLVGQVRIGGGAEYSAQGFLAWVRLGKLRVQVFPRKKKDKPAQKKEKKAKAPKEKQERAKENKPLSEKAGGALDYVRAMLPIGLEALGRFRKALRVDRLDLELTVGAPDPADAAMAYGQANAALGALWDILTTSLRVKEGRARVAVDFDAQSMTLYGTAALSMKLGQLLGLGLYFGFKALRAFLAVRRRNQSSEQQRKAA